MKYALLVLVFLLPSFAYGLHEYRVELDTAEGLALKDVFVEFKDTPCARHLDSGDHIWELYAGNELLDSSGFYINVHKIVEIVEDGLVTKGYSEDLRKPNVTLLIPYKQNATKLVIKNLNGTNYLEIDISKYAKQKPKLIHINEPEQDDRPSYEPSPEPQIPANIAAIVLLAIILLILIIVMFRARNSKI